MSDAQNSDSLLKVIPSHGPVERGSEPIEKLMGSERSFLIGSSAGRLDFRLGHERLANPRRLTLEAVVADAPDGLATMVAFSHPDETDRVIGVLVAPKGSKPEVDGVWVADDTEG